jgi:membrane dipeptidase
MSAHSRNHQYPVIDGHVDLLYDLIRHHPETPLQDLPDAWVTLPKLAAGAVRIIVSVFYCPDACNGPLKAADYLRDLLTRAGRQLRGVETILTVEALESCYQGVRGPGALLLLENADALLEFPPQALKQLGFRAVGLTHVGKNRIGDGNTIEEPKGLTVAGRGLVRELDRLGFAIDTAHLSDPAFREVAGIFSGPLFSSHTGLRAFNELPRNLDDGQIRTILSRRGVVGIAACPSLLSEEVKADISHLFCQIDWFVQKYGAEGVGIGSDLGGCDTVCHGFEDHTFFPRLAELLNGAGYPETAVAGIMGGNWYRFFSRLLANSDDGTFCRPAVQSI